MISERRHKAGLGLSCVKHQHMFEFLVKISGGQSYSYKVTPLRNYLLF
jgi:hypothetical protein